MTTRAKKIAFRSEFKNVLASIPMPVIEKESALVAQQLLAHPLFQSAKSVSCFLSMPDSEIQTREIVREILSRGKKCFIPLCGRDTMKMVQLHDWHDYETLPKNKWQIPEPMATDGRPDAFDCGLDLVVMPGMAFDRQGNRIGYGKGYYDKFLAALFERSEEMGWAKPATIAICLSAQRVPVVPIEDNDVKPDEILSCG
ncbi:hypothetical protein HDU91_004862 [Kappamyces sp. JEL0680]|nr:hypothetical protein HDU91_004862 [Kappamyces sp. JEL0680]